MSPKSDTGNWAPLRQPVFRALWTAALVSNIGTWMQDVGASWLMTELTTSPLRIALVQVATTLPIFLLGLVAGALADVVDRRRLLLVTQGWMLASSAALGLLTLTGGTTWRSLLALTFLLGLGTALNAPAWQAIIPELVGRGELPAALALNGIAINLARAAGPALAGAIIAAAGPAAAFLLNAASFLGVIVVLARWKRAPRLSVLPAESMPGAVLAGLRYARHTPALQAVLVRSAAFIVFASAAWALLPVIVRYELSAGPLAYGAVVGCLGAGAVLGALLLPRLRRSFPADRLVLVASLVSAAALLGLAYVPGLAALCPTAALFGGAWMTLLTSFHNSAQAALASWVRGRGLSLYLLVFFGCMAAGSALWGAVARHAGLRAALLSAGAGGVVAALATARLRLAHGDGPELAPSRHYATPPTSEEVEGDRGPVLVTVEYRIDPGQADQFTRAMRRIRRIRLRDGAFRWDLLNDAADPARFLEAFFVESWVEHLRQHERITVADRDTEANVRRFHVGPEPPRVTHYVARSVRR